jgi:hypothetical protein
MDGCASTVKAMEYIRDNGMPEEGLYFVFDIGHICASSINDDEYVFTREKHPVETWHDVFGMKRIKICVGWLAYINEKYYYMSC